MTEGYEPRWDLDLPYGKLVEARIDRLAEFVEDGRLKAEIKRKRRSDAHFYVELEHRPNREDWKPSGLNSTQAHVWIFSVADTDLQLWIPTERLRWALKRGLGRRVEETDGDCPTRGRLVSWADLTTTDLEPEAGVWECQDCRAPLPYPPSYDECCLRCRLKRPAGDWSVSA